MKSHQPASPLPLSRERISQVAPRPFASEAEQPAYGLSSQRRTQRGQRAPRFFHSFADVSVQPPDRSPVQRKIIQASGGGWKSDVTGKDYASQQGAVDAEQAELGRRRQEMQQFRDKIREEDLPENYPRQGQHDRLTPGDATKPRVPRPRAATRVPVVGVSNRPAFGYDSYTLGGKKEMVPSSLPGGFKALDRKATKPMAEVEKQRVQKARQARLGKLGAKPAVAELGSESERSSSQLDLTPSAKSELDRVSGLYIPGGQDYDPKDFGTRVPYEQALIREACNRGMPTMAICGGSRVLAEEFGGQPADLDSKSSELHQHHKTDRMAHSLSFPRRETILGGAAPKSGKVDKINSTHEKIVSHQGGELSPINSLPGVSAPENSELVVSAMGPDLHPEGFETRFGAPIVGITSHPEAIYGSKGAREKASPEGKIWSDNLFKGFSESMQAFAGKQQVNQEVQKEVPLAAPTAESSAVQLPPHIERKLASNMTGRSRSGTPKIQFGSFDTGGSGRKAEKLED